MAGDERNRSSSERGASVENPVIVSKRLPCSSEEKDNALHQEMGIPLGLSSLISFLITDINGEEASIVSISSGAERLFGYGPSEMVGQLLSSLMVPDRVSHLPVIFGKLSATKEEYSSETVLAKRSGELFPAHLKVYPVHDKDGNIVQALFFITDLSSRKKLEKELSRSEEKFRILIENSLDIITILDHDGTVTYHSPSVREILGYEKGELQRANIFDNIHPEDFPATMSALAEVSKDPGIPKVLEHRFRDSSGAWKIFESRGKALISGSGLEGIIVNSRDISDRKEAERELSRRLYFEETLSEISTRFVLTKDLDEAINISIEQLGIFSCASRAYIFTIDWKSGTMNNTHEWCYKDIEPQINNLQSLTLQSFPWWMKKLEEDGEIVIQDVSSLPTEAYAEKEILQEQGIRSILVLPFYCANSIRGYVGFDNVVSTWAWEKKDIRLLKVYAHILGQAFEKNETFRSYQSSLQFNLSLLNSSPNPIMVLDAEGAITYVNPSFGRVSGYVLKEVRGMRAPYPWWPEDDVEDCLQEHGSLLRGNNIAGEKRFISRKGETFRVYINSSLINGEEGETHYLVNWLDITERYRAERAHRASEEKYRSLVENLNEIIYSLNREGHITFISPVIKALLGYETSEMEGCAFTSFVHEEDSYTVEASLKDRWAGIPEKYEIRMIANEGKVHHVLVSSRPQFDGNNVIGVIGSLSDITAQRETEIKLEASYRKLDELMDGAASSIVSLLEIRDPYSAGHQRRVSILATAIAKEMKLTEGQVENVRISSLVHDIGKIHIPAEILSKPSKLRKTEFELLKAHPRSGSEVIRKFAFPEIIGEIVFQHHERFDGSGYPDGLEGEEILLEARILAVADVVEAMVSHRPYRPAHSFDDALEEISSKSGILYDPGVVAACISVFSKKGFFAGSSSI